jgi:alpha-L-fucosidase
MAFTKSQVINAIAERTSVELVFPKPTLINYAVIMEDYREGERIREYVLEGSSESQWLELSKGISVGRKRIDRFASVQLQRVRLRVGRSVAEPLIRSLAVFYAP